MQRGINPLNSNEFLAILLAVVLRAACGHWKLLGKLRRFLLDKLKQESPAVKRFTFSQK